MSNEDTRLILIVIALIALYFAYKTSVSAQATQNAAENPIVAVGDEIEKWFASLWGNSSGGTPETQATSS